MAARKCVYGVTCSSTYADLLRRPAAAISYVSRVAGRHGPDQRHDGLVISMKCAKS